MASRLARAAARLDAEHDVGRLLAGLGVELDDWGRTRRGRCPFHVDELEPPELVVDASTNTWTCPSCAPEGAGAVALVQRGEGLTRHAAVERLRCDDPITGAALHGLVKASTVRELAAEFAVDDDHELLGAVVTYYHRTLLDHAEALAYLRCRGVSAEAVEQFALGFADRTLGSRLPLNNRAVGNQMRSRMRELGILKSTGHERFRGCITVPIRDAHGNVVQIYGRRIGSRLRAGTCDHELLHEDRRGLFNLAAIEASDTIILTEGVFDALALWVHGHRNATCCFGTVLTDDLRAAIREHAIGRALIAFDRDREGDAGVEVVSAELAAMGLEVLQLVLPNDHDPASLVAASDDPKPLLDQVLRHPRWLAGKAENAGAGKPSPAPPVPTGTDDLVLECADRRWRVRGLDRNTSPGTMRLNLFVSREGAGFHVDVLDLYSSRHRAAFTKLAALEVCADEADIKKDLGRILLAAEVAQDEALRQRDAPRSDAPPVMTDPDREAALELLRAPDLLARVVTDFERLGVVGESDNLLLAYLVAISRRLPHPLALVLQSSPAAGKSSLLDAVLALVPDEDRVTLSALTGQALFYMRDLQHKVLAVAEEAGATHASYALKLLQSDGSLTIASTAKDPVTGRLVAHEYRVEGPVAVMMTTTSLAVDDELLSRCIVVAVDESPEQTRRIHAHQRRAQTLEAVHRARAAREVVRIHQDAQRLLRPLRVVNRVADMMQFADLRVQGRRDHRKLLVLVEVIALLHQHQREVHRVEHDGAVTEYLEVERADIELAQRLLAHAAGPRIDDLPPQTARVLLRLDAMVKAQGNDDPTFTRREVRDRLGLGDAQSKVHLRRLVGAEFLIARRARASGLVRYALAFDPATDVTAYLYDAERMASGWGVDGPRMAPGWGVDGPAKPANSEADSTASATSSPADPEQARRREPANADRSDTSTWKRSK